MYEEDTTDVEGVLAGNTEEDEDHSMDTGLYSKVPTSESNDTHLNASVMLPRGNSYVRGEVIGQKIDADGNDVGRENDNPILDTREYRIGFDDGEVIKLTENVISESMYAACNDSGN